MFSPAKQLPPKKSLNKRTKQGTIMRIDELAAEYQERTDCSHEEAVKAAFAAGYILSLIFRNTEAEKHFLDRYNECKQ